MSDIPAQVTPGYTFTPDADGVVQLTPDRLNLLGNPVVVVPLDDSIQAEDIKANQLTQKHVATLADAAVVGGIPVIFRIDIADGAGDTNVVLTYKTRIIDAWCVKISSNGAAGDTITIKNTGDTIVAAMTLGNDQTIVRAASIDDVHHEIAAGGTLRVTAAHNTNNACIVYVKGIRCA